MLGNTVLRDYEMGKQVASAGPGLQWKVYAGVKRSNRQVSGPQRVLPVLIQDTLTQYNMYRR